MKTSSARDIILAAAATDRLLRAADLGVAPYSLAQAEQAGVVERVIPGIYIGPSQPRQVLTEAAAWTLRQPAAVACLLTAAVYHDLTDAFEQGTWLFVPSGASPPRSRVSVVRVTQTAPRFIDPALDASLGIEHLPVHGVVVRVTGPDRTVLDLWRFPQLVSGEHALAALRRRSSASDFQVPAFARLAKRLDVWARVEPVLQGMMA